MVEEVREGNVVNVKCFVGIMEFEGIMKEFIVLIKYCSDGKIYFIFKLGVVL